MNGDIVNQKAINIAMRLQQFLEGKAFAIPYRWGNDTIDIPVIENPSADQLLVAYEKSNRSQSGPYLRGICYRNERLIVWDGFKACHDDIQHELYPDIPDYSSDFTLFEVTDLGVKVTRQGDYWLGICRHVKPILRAIVRSEYYKGLTPATVY